MVDVIDLTKALIRCPSVTPEDAGAQALLKDELIKLGFDCYDLPFSDEIDTVQNLFARTGNGGKHLSFAGHTDVVPAGNEEAWTHSPFEPFISDDGILYGRGASDMKGSVAAFVSAIHDYIQEHGAPKDGSISLIITGDEEDRCVNGTAKMLEWMKENDHIPDLTIVGEPTNPSELGQEIKIGRRGSLTGRLTVSGRQGHVAYQHLADNPLPRLAEIVAALSSFEFDQGSDFFNPTNLEFTTIDVGNTAGNVIPNEGKAQFNVRFNDKWSGKTLADKIKSIVADITPLCEIDFSYNSESFLTQPGDWTDLVRDSVTDIAGKTPDLTTTGGTSDARFVSQYCAVVECGPINATIHQIDENARVSDLQDLTRIYKRIIERFFQTA